MKNLMCISCFCPRRRTEIHQSAIHQFYHLFSPPQPPWNPKREAFGAVLKNRPEKKKLFRPAQPFVFPLNKASDKADGWCTSGAGARLRSRAHKQSHVSWQTDCSLQPPHHPDKNIMFQQHSTASGQYLICSSVLEGLCSGRGLGMH